MPERLFVLTGETWGRIEPLLPRRLGGRGSGRGGRWGDHRLAVEGMLWRFRTGSPWRDLPAEYGAWQTVYWRFNIWSKDGTFNQILVALQADAHAEGELGWNVSVDSTNARAHKHAAGALSVAVVDDAPASDGITGGKIELQESARRAS